MGCMPPRLRVVSGCRLKDPPESRFVNPRWIPGARSAPKRFRRPAHPASAGGEHGDPHVKACPEFSACGSLTKRSRGAGPARGMQRAGWTEGEGAVGWFRLPRLGGAETTVREGYTPRSMGDDHHSRGEPTRPEGGDQRRVCSDSHSDRRAGAPATVMGLAALQASFPELVAAERGDSTDKRWRSWRPATAGPSQ
jgi:hypothetical protein